MKLEVERVQVWKSKDSDDYYLVVQGEDAGNRMVVSSVLEPMQRKAMYFHKSRATNPHYFETLEVPFTSTMFSKCELLHWRNFNLPKEYQELFDRYLEERGIGWRDKVTIES